MGIMAHSLLWVMQDLYHQPYVRADSLHINHRDIHLHNME